MTKQMSKIINRTLLDICCSYDIINNDKEVIEEIRNTACFNNLYAKSRDCINEMAEIKVYLKNINTLEQINSYLKILNNICNCFNYNEDDHSISFKPKNKFHLKWATTCIRYLYEKANDIHYNEISENAIQIYNKYRISAIDALSYAHLILIFKNVYGFNHCIFKSQSNIFLVNKKILVENFKALESTNYISVQEVLLNCIKGSSFDTKEVINAKNIYTYLNTLKLRKRKN